MGTTRREDRRDSAERRRRELLEAADRVVLRDGPGASMNAIAAEAGITKPILYRHFGDRDGLIQAIAERFSADLLTTVTAPLSADVDAKALLRSTVDSYVSFIERETNLYRFMVQHPPERSGTVPGMSGLVDLIARRVAQVAGERLRAAGRDSGAAVPWAYGIIGLVHQAGDWWVDDRTMSRDTLITYLVNLLWDGLGAAPGEDAAEA